MSCNVLSSESSVLRRWKDFKDLMNEKMRRNEGWLKQEVGKISADEVRKALKRMKNRNGPDDI